MTMNKIKLLIILFLVTVCGIIVLQNTETVQTKILFITLTMPRAVLLIVSTLFGVAIGILFSLLWLRKKDKKEKKTDTAVPPPSSTPATPPATDEPQI